MNLLPQCSHCAQPLELVDHTRGEEHRQLWMHTVTIYHTDGTPVQQIVQAKCTNGLHYAQPTYETLQARLI